MSTVKPLTIDELRAKVRDTAVECRVCGQSYLSLVEHLRKQHNQSAGQYRNAYPGAAIASPVVVEFLKSVKKRPYVSAVTLDAILAEFTGEEHSIIEWLKQLPRTAWEKEDLLWVPKKRPFLFTHNASAIAMNLVMGRNLMMTGPTGCGKTGEVKQVMARLGVPLRQANMHGDVTYYTFIGRKEASPTQGTYFRYGILPQAMKQGYPVLLDEIDHTPPQISAVLFPLLEEERSIYIPETGETLTAEKGFAVYATGNTGGKGDVDGAYTGTEVQNAAFLNRFSIKLKADYLTPDQEFKFMESQYGQYLHTDFLMKTVKTADDVRAAFKNGELQITWSHRNVQDFCEFTVRLKNVMRSLELTLLNWLDRDDDALVRAIIKKIALDTASPVWK